MKRTVEGKNNRIPRSLVSFGLLAILVMVAIRLGAAPTPAEVRSMPLDPEGVAQSTEVPPLATCDPALMTPPVPGLHAIVSVSSVGFWQHGWGGDCPTSELFLKICLDNDGPGAAEPFIMRIENTGGQRFDVRVESLDAFERRCLELPDWGPPGKILLDPSCQLHYSERYWTGQVPYPEPLPTCTPESPISPTPSLGTATATSTLAPEVAQLFVPWLGRR